MRTKVRKHLEERTIPHDLHTAMRALLLYLFFIQSLVTVGQPLTPTLLTELPAALNETSGALRVGEDTWVILDSGNGPAIHRVDTGSGAILQTVVVANATNVDWEDITTDGAWCYLGDIGNNAGDRTDLRIYRFPLADLTNAAGTVTVDTIQYHYADQTDHTPAYDSTNWDCEAMIALDDSIFLFTKNWLNGHTNLYALPATPGVQVALPRGSYNTMGLITSAVRDPGTGTIALLGHTAVTYSPFVRVLREYEDNHFFSGTIAAHPIVSPPLQAEAILFHDPTTLVVGSENTPLNAASLWELHLPTGVADGEDAPLLRLSPQPAHRQVRVERCDPEQRASIFNMQGALQALVVVRTDGWMDLPLLDPGEYVLRLTVGSHPHHVALLIAH